MPQRPRHAFDAPPPRRRLPDLDDLVPSEARFRVGLGFWAWLTVAFLLLTIALLTASTVANAMVLLLR